MGAFVTCYLRSIILKNYNFIWKSLATLGNLGNWQAPGTWGTIAAVPVVFLARQYCNNLVYLSLVIAVIVSAYLVIHKSSNFFLISDDQTIIVDEFAGFWCCFIITYKFSFLILVLNFLIFRFFDISKIWPVNLAEKLPGSLGVLADDLVAGLLTNLSWMLCVKYIFC